MLVGNLRAFADAIISRNKHKATGELAQLADAIISGIAARAPAGPLRQLAEAIITRNVYKAPAGPLRGFADALISGNAYRAEGKLKALADAILTGIKEKVS
jgi:hypothetical protein